MLVYYDSYLCKCLFICILYLLMCVVTLSMFDSIILVKEPSGDINSCKSLCPNPTSTTEQPLTSMCGEFYLVMLRMCTNISNVLHVCSNYSYKYLL